MANTEPSTRKDYGFSLNQKKNDVYLHSVESAMNVAVSNSERPNEIAASINTDAL